MFFGYKLLQQYNKMRKNSFLTIASFFIIVGVINSQGTPTKRMPSIAIGTGVLSFKGDIGNTPYSKRRIGYNVAIEQKIGQHFGIGVNGLFGKLADSEIGQTRNLNFESKITQADLNFRIYFGNDSTVFSPFIALGVGYLLFDAYGDLFDKNGIQYNYWQDGTIRSLSEKDPNKLNAIQLKRDYTYETQLKDSVNYKRSSLALPICGGLNIRIFEKFHIKVCATYYLTFTDWIDNVKDGKNDNYIYANVMAQYTFGKKADVNANDKIHTTTVFSDLDKLDSDSDGVLDTDDNVRVPLLV